MNYLQAIAQSLDNHDIPTATFAQMHRDLKTLVKNMSGTKMEPTLTNLMRQNLPYENPSFGQTVNIFRQKLVMGTIRSIKSCPGAIGLQKRMDFNPYTSFVTEIFCQDTVFLNIYMSKQNNKTGSTLISTCMEYHICESCL